MVGMQSEPSCELGTFTKWNSQATEEDSYVENCLSPAGLGQADSQIMQDSSWFGAKLLQGLLLLFHCSSGEDTGDNTDDTYSLYGLIFFNK